MEDEDTTLPQTDSQMPDSDGGFLDMLYGENEEGNLQKDSTGIDMVQEDLLQDTEPEPATKKRSRAPKHKSKRPATKKRATKLKTNATDPGESSDEEEGNKRGPNWKEHWIVNLVHLRGTMHEKFSGMKKQGSFLYSLFLFISSNSCS